MKTTNKKDEVTHLQKMQEELEALSQSLGLKSYIKASVLPWDKFHKGVTEWLTSLAIKRQKIMLERGKDATSTLFKNSGIKETIEAPGHILREEEELPSEVRKEYTYIARPDGVPGQILGKRSGTGYVPAQDLNKNWFAGSEEEFKEHLAAQKKALAKKGYRSPLERRVIVPRGVNVKERKGTLTVPLKSETDIAAAQDLSKYEISFAIASEYLRRFENQYRKTFLEPLQEKLDAAREVLSGPIGEALIGRGKTLEQGLTSYGSFLLQMTTENGYTEKELATVVRRFPESLKKDEQVALDSDIRSVLRDVLESASAQGIKEKDLAKMIASLARDLDPNDPNYASDKKSQEAYLRTLYRDQALIEEEFFQSTVKAIMKIINLWLNAFGAISEEGVEHSAKVDLHTVSASDAKTINDTLVEIEKVMKNSQPGSPGKEILANTKALLLDTLEGVGFLSKIDRGSQKKVVVPKTNFGKGKKAFLSDLLGRDAEADIPEVNVEEAESLVEANVLRSIRSALLRVARKVGARFGTLASI
jgi:hypothetical protein